LAEVASTCALISTNEEGGFAVFPAFKDVGTASLLAHRVQTFGLY
jgi:hypothetical protein